MREAAQEAWARCRGFIEEALAVGEGSHTIEDVATGVETGLFQFWAGERCAIITDIWTRPRLKVLNFWLGGGDLAELATMRPHIEAWAQAQGCTRAMGGGRAGWGRAFAAAGYEPRWTIFTKELSA